MNNTTTKTVAPMTLTEKTERVRSMNRKWYSDRAKYGMKVADEILGFSMDNYFAEMVRREEGRP